MLQKKQKNILPILGGIVLVIAFPFLANAVGYTYAITLGCYVELYFIAVSGYDILFGFCGQINMGFEEKEKTMELCSRLLTEAGERGADLVVFPEMTLVGFTMHPVR